MKLRPVLKNNGFTLIEVLVVASLLGIILLFATTNLFSPVSRSKLDTSSQDIVSVLKEAQNKSMSGDSQGTTVSSEFGVHFEPNSYTIFKGTVYNSSDSENFAVIIGSNLNISTNLPCPSPPTNCNNVVFQKISGDVAAYNQTKNKICVTDTIGSSKRITFNLLGALSLQDGC